MKPQKYTAVRDASGAVTELQFWYAQGVPSLAQMQSLVARTWPRASRTSPERIVFTPGIASFRVSVSDECRAIALVEETSPQT